jgi:hypothetical protein
MRIRIQIGTLMRFGFRLGLCLDSDPNLTFHFDANLVSVPDPVKQHWVKLNYDSKV